jgi:hypothetical protein
MSPEADLGSLSSLNHSQRKASEETNLADYSVVDTFVSICVKGFEIGDRSPA